MRRNHRYSPKIWYMSTILGFSIINMSRRMTKPTKWPMRQLKIRVSLGIRPIWSVSLLSAWRSIGSVATHWAHSEDWSDRADAQADLSLHWAHSSFCWFCHAAAHILYCLLYRGSSATHWVQCQGGCPGWSESSLGAHIILLVLSWGISYVAVWRKLMKWDETSVAGYVKLEISQCFDLKISCKPCCMMIGNWSLYLQHTLFWEFVFFA